MVYPVAVIVIAVVVVGVILWKVIPTFAALFAGLGAQLPLPTRIVIALSNFLVNFMPFIIVGIGAIGYAFKSYYAHDGRQVQDRRHHAEAAGARPADAEDRRRAVLPHAVDAAELGRARFSTVSTSRRGRRATRSSKKRFCRRGRASSAAKRSRRR